MSDVPLNITSTPGGPSSLQAAVLLAPFSNAVELFKAGCMVSPGVRNCTRACGDPNLAWNSTATLHNCFVYTTVSELLSVDNPTNETIAIANDYGILARNNVNMTEVLNPINTCGSEAIAAWSNGRSSRGYAPLSHLKPLPAAPNCTDTQELIEDQVCEAAFQMPQNTDEGTGSVCLGIWV